MQEIEALLEDMGERARVASLALATLSSTRKNSILQAMADSLEASRESILAANQKDLEAAEQKGTAEAQLDRLRLDASRIAKMAAEIRHVSMLEDPVGEVLEEWERPNGLRLKKIRVPIGVIGIVFESRPNVTSDASVLCLKAGNATILRGGSEAIHSNLEIAVALQRGGQKAGLPADAIQLVPTVDREAVGAMCSMDRWIDVLIPRGGKDLIERVVSSARMPVIKHYNGICHVFVDAAADLPMAEKIVINAKCQRPGVCNALETLLVHQAVAPVFLPKLAASLGEQGVEIRADASSLAILGESEGVLPATEEDWETEYLALILSIRVVDSLEQATEHINTFGSHHSDAIITSDPEAAARFQREVDSAAVFWNASTRFCDGGEFGFGAEIGISTDKLHARGPMGLRELTSYKYLIEGEGQIRE